MKKIDYLIIGQGLAGTFLAFQLIEQGFSVMIVDKGHKYSSSYVAAGVINPLVLKRYTVTWRAKEFLNYNTTFYKELDQFLDKQYHFKLPIEKLISSAEEEIFWHHRFKEEDVSYFIDNELKLIDSSIQPSKPFKVGTVKQTSWLNISQLLIDFRSKLVETDSLLEEIFDFKDLKNSTYKSIEFKKIVFCEGANAIHNPFFGNLPFTLNKGQLLTINSEILPKNKMLKKKVFILPTINNEFKIGATYSWKWNSETEELAHQIEPEKTELLQEFLEEITISDYKIIKEEVGIRPSVKDRRPLIGNHKKYKNYFIFNGMGSRGCFMAPLLTKEFIAFAEDNKPLHPEVELNRFNY